MTRVRKMSGRKARQFNYATTKTQTDRQIRQTDKHGKQSSMESKYQTNLATVLRRNISSFSLVVLRLTETKMGWINSKITNTYAETDRQTDRYCRQTHQHAK